MVAVKLPMRKKKKKKTTWESTRFPLCFKTELCPHRPILIKAQRSSSLPPISPHILSLFYLPDAHCSLAPSLQSTTPHQTPPLPIPSCRQVRRRGKPHAARRRWGRAPTLPIPRPPLPLLLLLQVVLVVLSLFCGGDGHRHGQHHEEDSPSSGEEDAADRETAVGKREEAAVPVPKEVQQVSVEVVAPVPASEEAQEVGVESVPDGVPEAGVVADLPVVVPADGPSSAKEEVVEVAEPAAETSKTSIDVDSLSHGTEQKPVPVLNNLVSQVPRESTELCRATADSEASTMNADLRLLLLLACCFC
ncbi:hypothetical protein BHM03_00048576 [Ensete ventricosum]|nr:hypothetical protein BHM03_00048576 [Ensete ventricosum]